MGIIMTASGGIVLPADFPLRAKEWETTPVNSIMPWVCYAQPGFVRPQAAAPKKRTKLPVADIGELSLRIQLTEPEAALLAGWCPKKLGNKRRKREIPRELYCQQTPSGKVYYHTQKFIAYIDSNYTPLKNRRA